jgi:uncharacterized protein
LILYPDTSLLVAVFVGEPGSDRADAWLSENLSSLGVSGWLDLEFASALAAKARNRGLPPDQRSAALSAYRSSVVTSAERLRILEQTFVRAAEMIAAAEGLRGGDALHLAIAEAHGAALVTLDRRQAELGAALGVTTRLL